MTSTRTTTKTSHYLGTLVALAAALTLAASLLLTQAERPARAAFPGQNGKIAFVSNRDGNDEIYAMNPDGSGQVNLTNLDSASDLDPDWGVSAAVTANTAPTVTNLSPVPNSTTSDRTPTIKATVTDKETNLQKSNIKFFLDGQEKTGFTYSASTDRLSFTPASALKAGTHTAKVVATDPSALSTTKSWSFTVK